MFIGRDKYLETLDKLYVRPRSDLIVVYGRRRIGKSYLCQRHLKRHVGLSFEGVEAQSSTFQIKSIIGKLKIILSEYLQDHEIHYTWEGVLDLFTIYLREIEPKRKKIIFLDEYQWLASGRSVLTSLIKRYWDNEWKDLSVQLILCGSVSSFMVKKVIKSKALYGRIDSQLNIEALSPDSAAKFFKKDVSSTEILKYLLVFGGVPKYLIDLDLTLSFEQNLTNIFFNKDSSYVNEYEKIFYSQFKEHQVYERIVDALSLGPLTLGEISEKLSLPSGGGLKSYLVNLENAKFIVGYVLSPEKMKGKIISYKIVDPFLRFYLYFVRPNMKLIQASSSPKLAFNSITKGKLNTYLGLAFENYCNLYAMYIAGMLGFEEEVVSWGPIISRKSEVFQADLVYFRSTQIITLCELKFSNSEIAPSIIAEMEPRIDKLRKKFPNYSLQKALITTIGQSKALKASSYFDHSLVGKELLARGF
jgi:AAA+ ATPase superfamily predicted ATPase